MALSDQIRTVATSESQTPSLHRRTRDLGRKLTGNSRAIVGAVILLLFVAVALLAPIIAPGNPNASVATGSTPPSLEHLFGTTSRGQDVFALTVWGGRSSLGIGITVGVLATFIAVLIGIASAYFGRVVDDLLALVTNIFLLIPGLPLLIILAAFLPAGPGTVVLVLVATGWAGGARIIRSQALAVRAKDYVDAAITVGERPVVVMMREILPNMASVVMSTLLGCVTFGIGAQAGLEFLGLGDVSAVSWGTNLFWSSNEGALLTGAWWTFVPPGVAIALVAFSLALINNAVDEITNPRLAARKRKATAR